jgi:serine protease Do
MLEHLRRILIAIAIFACAGLLYRQWRVGNGGYGLFQMLAGQPAPGKLEKAERRLNDDDVPALLKLSEESAKLAAAVLPSVVSIDTKELTTKVKSFNGIPFQSTSLEPGLGSGVIVSAAGHIVTNFHVLQNVAVLDHIPQIAVTTQDHKRYEVEIVGMDPYVDIAVLRIKGGKGDFPALPFANSDAVRTGESVFAVGNPFGLTGTVTRGIISATQRRLSDSVSDFIQTDTVINPGNSGGPLVNVHGEIVGINVAIYMGEEKVHSWQGVGLAVPSNDAKATFDVLLKHGVPQSGYLGVEFDEKVVSLQTTLGASLKGALVSDVVPRSPAEKAGLKKGDVIIKFGDQPVDDLLQIKIRMRNARPGQSLSMVVVRGEKEITLNATIQTRPPGK